MTNESLVEKVVNKCAYKKWTQNSVTKRKRETRLTRDKKKEKKRKGKQKGEKKEKIREIERDRQADKNDKKINRGRTSNITRVLTSNKWSVGIKGFFTG